VCVCVCMCVCVSECLTMLMVLWPQGDYDAAISQYVETIPTVEPSYVIRKVRVLINEA